MYNKKIMQIFQDLKHVGQLKGASGTGKAGSMESGDVLKVYLKISEDGIVSDAKFKAQGTTALIATSCATIDHIIGKTVDEALKLTDKDISKLVGGIPENRMTCTSVIRQAIENAVRDYRKMLVKKAEQLSIAVENN